MPISKQTCCYLNQQLVWFDHGVTNAMLLAAANAMPVANAMLEFMGSVCVVGAPAIRVSPAWRRYL